MKPEEKKPSSSISAIILCILFLAGDILYYIGAKGQQVNESVTFDSQFRQMEIINGTGSAMVVAGAGLLMSRLKEKKAVMITAVLLIAAGMVLVGSFILYAI